MWKLVAAQHGVVSRQQLLELGYSAVAIKHRVATGRLWPVHGGVYAVGRPDLTREGTWMAAVLSCGTDAALSHGSAAHLWNIRPARTRLIEISVPIHVARRRPGLTVHRRQSLGPGDVTRHHAIPVTTPAYTLIDLAARLAPAALETAVNEADKHDLIDPEALRIAVEAAGPRPGVAPLRRLLDRLTFTLTDSELERLFLPLARKAGLPALLTRQQVNGFRVDFFCADLGLVVETDGLRYHRTPGQQAADRLRDQAHTAAGLTALRFTHAQVRFEPAHVKATLATVARRLAAARV